MPLGRSRKAAAQAEFGLRPTSNSNSASIQKPLRVQEPLPDRDDDELYAHDMPSMQREAADLMDAMFGS